MFPCSRCGACCANLNNFYGLYSELDDGTGACIHLDKITNLCTIYDNRPKKCKIDEAFELFSSHISYDEYIALTKNMCEYLRSRLRRKQ